jgi:hypothetical protein
MVDDRPVVPPTPVLDPKTGYSEESRKLWVHYHFECLKYMVKHLKSPYKHTNIVVREIHPLHENIWVGTDIEGTTIITQISEPVDPYYSQLIGPSYYGQTDHEF